VVIDELNVSSLAFDPAKDQSPLIVDSDAVETFPVAAENLQSVAGRRPKVEERMCGVQEIEFSNGCLDHGRRIAPYTRRPSSVKYVGGSAVPE
jgi:hypothetical protein